MARRVVSTDTALHGASMHTPRRAESSLQTSASRSQVSTGSVGVPVGLSPCPELQANARAIASVRMMRTTRLYKKDGADCYRQWVSRRRPVA